MKDNGQKPNLEGGIDMSDSVETRLDDIFKPVHPKKEFEPCFFEFPPIIIDQPCDNRPRLYWQAADPVNGFVWIANRGRCVMKVCIEQAGKPPLIDHIAPGQTKLFSSEHLKGLSVECVGCEPVKCCGEAKLLVKCQ